MNAIIKKICLSSSAVVDSSYSSFWVQQQQVDVYVSVVVVVVLSASWHPTETGARLRSFLYPLESWFSTLP